MVKVVSLRFRKFFVSLPYCFSKDLQKREFLDIYLTPVFRVRNFTKYINYEGHIFSENVQNLIYMSKMQKKIQKKFFLLDVIVSELAELNCLY